jgi:DNA/RNA endonuclease YhcR with UshA esterase domain
MEDHLIFKIALVMSILGVVGMVVSADMITAREIQIKDIDRGMLDEDVSLEGVVQNVKKSSSSEQVK